jgi:uncharacterized protein (TIGR03663 family)
MQAHRTTYLAFLIVVVVVAAAFRLPDLESRPMHADEAVQVARFRKLWLEHEYRYNPDEFHGPTLPYSTLPSVWFHPPGGFAETSESTYRVVTALYGCAIVALTGLLLVDGLGARSTLFATCLAALSPCLVYYSRYYIHETLVVFFSLAAIGAGWRYLNSSRRLRWCVLLGASLGCLQATKETSVLAFSAASLATLSAIWLTRRDTNRTRLSASVRWWHVALGVLTAVAVATVLLSSFFHNLRGPVDGVLTYVPWVTRAATTSVHQHPWHFYLHRLTFWRFEDGPIWSESLIVVLATIAIVVAVFRPRLLPPGSHRGLVCWLGSYVMVLLAIYSAIPYKTPWCMIGFVHGATLLAGVGAATLVQANRTRTWKACVVVLLLLGSMHLGWQSYRASFVLSADKRNPYVYAHTTVRIEQLVEILEQLRSVAASGNKMTIKVVWDGNYYWPLPWYLRSYSNVEYWNRVPDSASAAVIIASPSHDAALTAQLDESHFMTGYYEIRPNVLSMLWVREDIWVAHVEQLQNDRRRRD